MADNTLFLILDLLVFILGIVLAYLIYLKLVKPPLQNDADFTERKTQSVKEQDAKSLLAERLHLKLLLTDAKKKFLSGEITKLDFKMLSNIHHAKLKQIEARLKQLGAAL